MEEPVPVVGVGASAGGLEALREMFQGFTDPTGMAFVVVQHLDPTHESLMAQLIERYTLMTVKQAEGGEPLEMDHVYVIPPGHGLAVHDNVLQLTEFTDPRGMRRPIDDFFESLAEDRQRLAACVILSGTGADGSRGLRAIKEHGGLCIAQQPDTARYDGMPVSAIGTGLVDIECQPSEIIDSLRKFFDRNPDGRGLEDEASEVIDNIDELCEILREEVGHDFSGYKRATLVRRIARRMQVLGTEDAREYVKRVRADHEECGALFRDLLINVTKFFRDTQEFETLRRDVIEPMVENSRNASELRIWIAGCSSGEEAYTIAMMFAAASKRLDVFPYIQIFATDIDEKMLSIARSGTYPLSALDDIPQEYRSAYTICSSDSFTIAPKIRDMVRFSLHNLVRDPPFSNIDLVSCRNLLIYFDDALQQQVLPLFHFSLRNDGYLFLGSSEAIGRFDDLYEIVDQSARLFKRKDVKSRYTMQASRSRPATFTKRVQTETSQSVPRSNPTEIAALKRIADKYAPVSLLLDEEGILLERWGSAGKFLNFPDRLERNIHVPSLARPGLRELVGPMLREVRGTNRRVIKRDVEIATEFGRLPTTVVCEPVNEVAYLLVLRDTGSVEPFGEDFGEDFEVEDGQLRFLEEELQSTRHRLRSTVEELETTNEELKSSNEEMMSMNEELQSTNEELTTVNDELKNKVDQVTVAHADLKNFFDSTDMVVMVVDADLKIRSFTEAAGSIFAISSADIDRPLSSIETQLDDQQYVSLASKAAEQGRVSEYRSQVSADGRQFIGRVVPYQNLDGSIEGATLVFTDVTKALALESDLQQERERLRLALEVAGIGIWEYEPSTDRTVLDATERSLLGLNEDDEGATMEPILAKLPSADRDRINSSLRKAMDGDEDFDEVFRVPLADGSYRWLHGLGRRLSLTDMKKFIGVTYDITSEREILEQREMMISEMNHRVKNLFAVISAMISITSAEADEVGEFANDLRKRIYALGQSHALTNRSSKAEQISLEVLIETVVSPTLSSQDFKTSGGAIEVKTSQLTPLALIFHEWATNASKYGALSIPDGKLHVDWKVEGQRVLLKWEESGFRSETDISSGFGTRLIEATVRQLKGTIEGHRSDNGYIRTLTFDLLPEGA
ncbi:chemotaxis protein [Altererythrobacter luteolus]|uniref:Chemotaxis protein n=1 Tax=Pontixanthobacter luteolus TaxID=295089 RepID=A0A6I4V668_9SPHN|nr:CheR family methyltransferase [Pontixanthobacter luteolus]MXP48300.1 chemotaxis protein [Pontixanthobacter luteolus]